MNIILCLTRRIRDFSVTWVDVETVVQLAYNSVTQRWLDDFILWPSQTFILSIYSSISFWLSVVCRIALAIIDLHNLPCSRAPTTRLWACGPTPCGRFRSIGIVLAEIRAAGPYRGASTGFMVASNGAPYETGAWWARRMTGRWPDGGRRSTVARWMRRRAATAYAPIPDLTWPSML